jgi:hypothetical protein
MWNSKRASCWGMTNWLCLYMYSHSDFAWQDNLYSTFVTSLEEICRKWEVVNNLHLKLGDKSKTFEWLEILEHKPHGLLYRQYTDWTHLNKIFRSVGQFSLNMLIFYIHFLCPFSDFIGSSICYMEAISLVIIFSCFIVSKC